MDTKMGREASGLVIAIAAALACGCGADPESGTNNDNLAGCGDGALDLRTEECDDGVLNSDSEPDACRTDCRVARCGDQVRDTGEACDGADFGGDSCVVLGFGIGALVCTADCTVDTSGCSPPSCGDGTQQAGEQCDDGAANSDSTPDACRENCRLPGCGDGVADAGEECDEADLRGETCEGLGYSSGSLSCTIGCELDTDACLAYCGNGRKEPPEDCDGADLNGATCQALGFSGGALGCSTDCSFDGSQCYICGNGIQEPGEACDDGGTSDDLTCSADCQHFCGDGQLDAGLGEECDGWALGGLACVDLGFDGGVLRCDAACSFDTTTCETCGDGVCDSFENPTSCPLDCIALSCSGIYWCEFCCPYGDTACENGCHLAAYAPARAAHDAFEACMATSCEDSCVNGNGDCSACVMQFCATESDACDYGPIGTQGCASLDLCLSACPSIGFGSASTCPTDPGVTCMNACLVRSSQGAIDAWEALMACISDVACVTECGAAGSYQACMQCRNTAVSSGGACYTEAQSCT